MGGNRSKKVIFVIFAFVIIFAHGCLPLCNHGLGLGLDGKHFEADIDIAKSRLAGEYLMDCQTTGGTLGACKTAAAGRLKDELKSDRSLSDAIVKTQFEVLAAAANCAGMEMHGDGGWYGDAR